MHLSIGASSIVYLISSHVKKKDNFHVRFNPIERTDREGMTNFLGKMKYTISAGSHEVGGLERRESQPDAECRKTCGRGVKRTQILGMGCSTPVLALWQV